jgi:hypothetical protein
MMMNQVYIIKLLVGFFYMAFVIQLPANEPIADMVNTDLVKASIKIVQPVSPSSCIVEMTVTGITERTLFINKAQNAISMGIELVDSEGKACPLTEKGERYYGEKAKKRHSVSGVLIWLKKDEPISNKMDLAEFFQLQTGRWILKISLPLLEVREEGKRSGGGLAHFEDIKIEIQELKK